MAEECKSDINYSLTSALVSSNCEKNTFVTLSAYVIRLDSVLYANLWENNTR